MNKARSRMKHILQEAKVNRIESHWYNTVLIDQNRIESKQRPVSEIAKKTIAIEGFLNSLT